MLSVLGKVQKGKRRAGSIKDWFKLGSPIRWGERGKRRGRRGSSRGGQPEQVGGKGERERRHWQDGSPDRVAGCQISSTTQRRSSASDTRAAGLPVIPWSPADLANPNAVQRCLAARGCTASLEIGSCCDR